jgi:hypothetical protein
MLNWYSILEQRWGKAPEKTTHLLMRIVHRQQQVASTMNLKQDIGTQMPMPYRILWNGAWLKTCS